MLSSPKDFAALMERGTIRSHPLLATRVLRTDLGTTRFGLATSRALGSAVVRNRVRRRLRAALRAVGPDLRPGWDVLVVARPGLVAVDHRTLGGTLERLLRRSGVLGGETGVHRTGDS
jgi:ribonuclease P protein component